MDIPELLHNLTLQGFSLGVVGCDSIEVQGPVAKLSPSLKQALQEHKPSLLQILQPRKETTGDDYAEAERWAIQHEHELPPQEFNPDEFGAAGFCTCRSPRIGQGVQFRWCIDCGKRERQG